MLKKLTLLVILGAMYLPGAAFAQQIQGAQRVRQFNRVITSAPLFPFAQLDLTPEQITGMDLVTLVMDHNSVTADNVTMQCSEIYPVSTGVTVNSIIQTCLIQAGGECNSAAAQWVKSVPITANTAWSWRIDVSGYSGLRCIFTKGADVNDLLTVYAVGSTY